ncbi:X2-like carbohydrate binding domain-containing protein [Mediterraneibacter sp.]
MKKKKKGKFRWLSVLLTGCLLLSIIPATAFAAEDTTPAKSENIAGEETPMPEQQNATEDTSNSVIENTSEDANTENQDEQTDKSHKESSTEVVALALEQPKPDYLPHGVTHSKDNKHTYHTQVNVTANVSVKDSNGAVVETKQVTESSEFLKGGVGTLQAKLAELQAKIEKPYQTEGTITRENETQQPIILDHFETASLYTFTPTSGDPMDFSTDLEAAKQYFNENPDATGTFTETLDMHEYQKWNYTYNLIVQEPDAVDEAITMVDIGNIWKNLDASQPIAFTAEVNPNSECANQMTLTDEFWMQWTIDGPIIAKSNPKKPVAGATYRYGVKLTAKDGYYFHDGFKGSGVGCTVICDGSTITAFSGTLSDDRKQLILWFNDIKVTATDESSQNSIGDVDIEGVTFNYEPGDVPKATAYKCDPWDEQYDIEYEYWEEMETNADGESVPVKYWYSDENKNSSLAQNQKITTFEEGKTYMYSISLKARDGNTFAANSKVMVNGTNVNNANVTNTGTGLFVVAVRTIKPETVQLQNISVVEINNATISFKVGDKPVFTGKTSEDVPYIYQSEYWSTDGGKKYYYSADFWNDNNPDDLFTEFESGKTYTYGIYFKAKEGYCFTTDTKLKINGKYYGYDITDYDPLLQYPNGGYATMWVDTDLTITPQASGTTPEYKITKGANSSWTQNSDGTLKFVANGDFSKFAGVKVDGTLVAADKYIAVSGSTVITLKKDYLITLSVGKHTLTIVYNDGECSTEFEIKAASITSSTDSTGNNSGSTSSKVNKPDTSETTSPITSDTNNMFLWFIILFVSGSVTIGTLMVHRKKQYNR